MSDIFFLVLRRLRTPLILLILMYAVATLGMTLIPGVDPNGDPWRMSFFHAFYFVSFMGTTIGFGEIPYAFTDSQRAWVLICIYTSVIAWLYAIGNMLKLLQDETFQSAVAHRNFERGIQRIDLPFYIICGFGETGRFINKGLTDLNMQTVIIDHNLESTRSLELENLAIPPIVLTADITEPQNLIAAGINHKNCHGVIAVTQTDHTNLQVAVIAKLINSGVPIICRSEIEDEAANMASFGTDSIINPYITFARRMSLLAQNPGLYRIQNWFINQHSAEHISEQIAEQGLPHGKWIVCGYGRLGKAIQRFLDIETIEIVIVDPDPEAHGAPADTIEGRGTEAATLEEAGVNEASMIVAASDDDANNLSILITARQLNPNIITIGRVSKEVNHTLFEYAKCDYILRRGQVVANEALTIISRPLVTRFIKYSTKLSATETEQLIQDICQLTGDRAPVTWRLIVDQNNAPAFVRFLQSGRLLSVSQISSHKLLPEARCIPLLLQRNGVSHLLPSGDMTVEIDDQLLLCAKRGPTNLTQRLRDNIELLDTLIDQNPHHIPLLRWWARRKSHSSQSN